MQLKGVARKEQAKRQQRKAALGLVFFSSGILIVVGALELFILRHDPRLNRQAKLTAHATIKEPFIKDGPPKLVTTIRNAGSIDAHELSVANRMVTGYFKSEAEAFDKMRTVSPGISTTRLILVAGESFSETLEYPTPLTQEDRARLAMGALRMYFLSELTYSDGFGSVHRDQVCEYFDPAISAMAQCDSRNSSN
ncbi:MAG TPA: hypothetical protein VIB39_02705 [Candidatus Angelobacter sp.]|jgi:hypothetical protein